MPKSEKDIEKQLISGSSYDELPQNSEKYEEEIKRRGVPYLFERAFSDYNYSVKEQRCSIKYLIFFTIGMTAWFAYCVTDSKIRGDENGACLFGLMCSLSAGASLGILGMGYLKHKIQEKHTRGERMIKPYVETLDEMLSAQP